MRDFLIIALEISFVAIICYGVWRLWRGYQIRRCRSRGIVSMGRSSDVMLAVAKWVLFAAVLVPFCVVFLYGGVAMWSATLVIAGMIAARKRTMQRSMLLATMASAAQQGHSLVESIEACGDGVDGLLGGDMRRLALNLDNGFALPDSIVAAGNPLNPSATRLIIANVDDGNLASVLADALEAEQLLEPSLARSWGKILYFCMLLGFVAAILTFLMVVLIPRFFRIFADYGMELPAVTNLLVFFVSSATEAIPLVQVVFFLLCLFLVDIGLHFVGITPQPVSGRWLLRGLQRATMLRALAYAVDRRRPISPVLEALMNFRSPNRTHRRLGRAIDRIERGEQWSDALRDERLVTPAQAAFFQSAERVGNAGWALRESAESTARHMTYRLDRGTEALFPLVVLAVSLFVLLICVAFIVPLVQLILSLA